MVMPNIWKCKNTSLVSYSLSRPSNWKDMFERYPACQHIDTAAANNEPPIVAGYLIYLCASTPVLNMSSVIDIENNNPIVAVWIAKRMRLISPGLPSSIVFPESILRIRIDGSMANSCKR